MLSSMPMLGGVRLAPIPASMLPSTATFRAPDPDDAHGGGYLDPVTVTNVRYDRSSEFAVVSDAGAEGGYAVEGAPRGTVYVDAATSAGAYEVAEGSLVSVDGGEPMEAVRVTRHDHLDGTPHHWEVEVR